MWRSCRCWGLHEPKACELVDARRSIATRDGPRRGTGLKMGPQQRHRCIRTCQAWNPASPAPKEMDRRSGGHAGADDRCRSGKAHRQKQMGCDKGPARAQDSRGCGGASAEGLTPPQSAASCFARAGHFGLDGECSDCRALRTNATRPRRLASHRPPHGVKVPQAIWGKGARSQSRIGSSTGRALVSKTRGCMFEAYPVCQGKNRLQKLLTLHAMRA